MSPVPLAARVVEVISDLGPAADSGYRYGSGCIVRGRTVLTAAHVVADAVSVVLRDPAKREYSATVDPRFVGDAEGPGPDLALLEIDDPTFNNDLPEIGLAAVDRDSAGGEPVERCHAVGYPWFAETRSRTTVRDTVDAIGVVPVLSKLAAGLLSVQVTVAPRALPPQEIALVESEWSGMSGAPVVTDGCLLGVVSEHAPRAGPSAITAVPLTALEPDSAHPGWGPGVANAPEWWARLGVSGPAGLRRVPAKNVRLEPAYKATVREIHGRTPQLLGRERELAALIAFAAGSEGYRWLTGGAWAGKTALVAEAATAALPPSVDVVAYFLSRREANADSNRFLVAVVPQLAYLLDEDPPVPDLVQFRALWSRAAGRAAATDRHLLLVVDGLDEDLRPTGLPSVASLLPAFAGGRAHVLVTSRPYLEPDVPVGHPLSTAFPVPLEASPDAADLADRARNEIEDLLHGEDQDLAADVLGVLTAAAGPLAIDDLAALTGDLAPAAPAWSRLIDRLVTEKAARSLQPAGPADRRRYQFAHASLLEQAQSDPSLRILRHPDYRHRIERWAEQWREAGWPVPATGDGATPRYLLDEYPATLKNQPLQLAALAGDVGWVASALQTVGVDKVLAGLATAKSASADPAAASALLAIVRSQVPYLRPPEPIGQPGYVLRQLCLRAAELGENRLAAEARACQLAQPGPRLVPLWTERRASALSVELGRHDGDARAVAGLPDGRVVSGGHDGRVLVWNPASPGAGPVELGHHDSWAEAVAVLPDGRVVSGGGDGRVLVWDPASPGAAPVELGRHDRDVLAIAVLPDGRVVSGGVDRQMRVWDPATPGAGPVELGSHGGWLRSLAVLPDGRVVTGGGDGREEGGDNARVLVWDPGSPGAGPVDLGGHDGITSVAAVLPDGRVVSGGDDRRFLLWDPASPGASPVELGRPRNPIRAVAGLPNGRVVTGGGPLLVWDPASPGAQPAELGDHDTRMWAVAVLPDGRVGSCGVDGRVLLWDPASLGAGPGETGRHHSTVTALAALPDSRFVSGGDDHRVLLWDPTSYGAGPVDLGGDYAWLQAMVALSDGRVVSGNTAGEVLVWNPAAPDAGQAELGRHNGWVQAAGMLPDGRVASCGTDGRVLVWDPGSPGTGPVELGQVGYWLWALAVLPDGRVVSGGGDERVASGGLVLLWDPGSPGTGPVELGRHDGQVFALAVLPDGRVAAGGGGRVLVWDPASPGTGPVELGRHDGEVSAVVALRDGRVISSDSWHMHVWDADHITEIARAACLVRKIAVARGPATDEHLLTGHEGPGATMWSLSTAILRRG